MLSSVEKEIFRKENKMQELGSNDTFNATNKYLLCIKSKYSGSFRLVTQKQNSDSINIAPFTPHGTISSAGDALIKIAV
jgi:hypothetical protein